MELHEKIKLIPLDYLLDEVWPEDMILTNKSGEWEAIRNQWYKYTLSYIQGDKSFSNFIHTVLIEEMIDEKTNGEDLGPISLAVDLYEIA